MPGKGRPRLVSDDAIVEAVREAAGNIVGAAQRCGVTYRAVYKRLVAYPDLAFRARRAGWVPSRGWGRDAR